MSLLQRLLISVTVAIAIILAGTLAWSVIAARQYLDGQLRSEGENAASALALTLSQPANQDPVTRELLMMGLFDSGRFRAIGLRGPQGQALFERQQPAQQPYRGQAPAWFARLLPLASPPVERAVSDGWRQVGQLWLTVESGYASDALWRSSTRMAALVLAAGLAWALFVVGLLSWFRRVLQREVESQVLAIGAAQGGRRKKGGSEAGNEGGKAPGPRVAELAAVVAAIANTRERVRATAQEQGARIEKLELALNTDAVTGLANRRYIVNELRRVLLGEAADGAEGAPGVGDGGHMLLFRQRDLAAINTHLRHDGANAWLATMARQLRQLLKLSRGAQFGRLNGSDFVVLLPGVAGPRALALVDALRQALQSLRVALESGHSSRWAYALTDYEVGDPLSDVLARLDKALMHAESAGHDEVEFLARAEGAAEQQAQRASQWQETLQRALATPNALSLAFTPLECEGPQGRLEQLEASLLLYPGEGAAAPLPSALFFPVAVRLGLSAAFDLQALRLGLDWLQGHLGAQLVLRVALPSVTHEGFAAQVYAQLREVPTEVRRRLVFELDAYALQSRPEETLEFAGMAQIQGVGLALRRLDQSPKALASLHLLTLRYVKVGGDFAERALSSPGVRYLLAALLGAVREQRVAALVPTPVSAAAAELLQAEGASLVTA